MDANLKSKAIHYGMLFAVVFTAALAANWAWQYMNKPTVMPPSSTPAPTS